MKHQINLELLESFEKMLDKSKLDFNKLNVMNYYVGTPEGHYYITDGIRGLWRFCKFYKYNFRQVISGLSYENQWVNGSFNITQI